MLDIARILVIPFIPFIPSGVSHGCPGNIPHADKAPALDPGMEMTLRMHDYLFNFKQNLPTVRNRLDNSRKVVTAVTWGRSVF